MKEILGKLAQAVINCLPEESERLAREALKEGIDPLEAVENGLSKGIKVVGEGFEAGKAFLPDLMMAAETMKSGLRVLEPELRKSHRTLKSLRRVVIGTVAGDIHDIGNNIVSTTLSAAGFEVHNLGVDVPADRFVHAVKELKPDILGLSALLSVTIPQQREVIEALKRAGLRDKVRVMVGGGAVTQSWAEKIGADGYGADALEVVGLAKRLIEKKHTKHG